MFTNLVLILYDRYKNILTVSNVAFSGFDKGKYAEYCKDKSIIIACHNTAIARSIKHSLDAVCSNNVASGFNFISYKPEAFEPISDLISVLEKHVKSIKILDFGSIDNYEQSKNDFLYHSLNFFKVFDEIINQLDDLIKSGCRFDRVHKKEIKSTIYGHNIDMLNHVNLSWVYNDGENVVIDYSGLIEWRSIGVHPTHRRLVELKYFR